MQANDAWTAAYHQLELQLGRARFDTWLRSAVYLGFEDNTFYIGVHNGYAQDMLQHRLYRHIRRVLTDVYGEEVEIQFEVHKAQIEEANRSQNDEMPLFRLLAQQPSEDEAQPLHEIIGKPKTPDLPESELNDKYLFNRFIVNSSNQVVFEAARAVADYPATVYNPFFVYGGVGLGKTHLLQAVGNACQERGYRVLYVPSEAFTNDLIHAIRNRTTAMFREKYRGLDVLLIDDIQFIGGKETTQEEFFHTFNALVNFNKQVVVASDRHPRELATFADRLRSRFQGGLVADIQPPELETRIAILELWASERNVSLPRDILHVIAERSSPNIRDLSGIFNQVAIQYRMGGEQTSRFRTEATLSRYHSPRRRLGVLHVIKAVAEAFNLDMSDLMSKKRASRINKARQVAMYLSRDLTDASLPQIGSEFGGRSHTTVLHGCNKIAEELETDKVLSARVQKIQNQLLEGG